MVRAGWGPVTDAGVPGAETDVPTGRLHRPVDEVTASLRNPGSRSHRPSDRGTRVPDRSQSRSIPPDPQSDLVESPSFAPQHRDGFELMHA